MRNAELAYLLGMIAGKGQIIRHHNDTDVIIEIPHKSLIIEGMDAKLSVKASLDDIRNNVEPLIGARLQSLQTDNKTTIKFSKNNEDFLIREINRHFASLSSWRDFRIPQEIYASPSDIKNIFTIALADVTAHIRSSNCAYGNPSGHRVYIEFPANWYMVIDIGNLLYDLDVPIHNIDWGHPNMRDPKMEKFNRGNKEFWAKEHQIKIFADEFEKVGFRIEHKRQALKRLANRNRDEWNADIQRKIAKAKTEESKEKLRAQLGKIEASHHKYYWETKTLNKPKPHHPMETSEKIPAEIRGQHFNSWKEICAALGYKKRD